MATQVVDASSEMSAVMVGNAFVTQFYHILHATPELVHRFFQDSSTMSRPDCEGNLQTVTSMKGINEFILSLDCTNNKAEILTADAQASHMNGVILLVTGCLTGKDNVRRKFTESFFLAPQEKGYFVLNDAFRFVEEVGLPLVSSADEKESHDDVPAAPLTLDQETVEVPDIQTPAAEVTIEREFEVSEEPRNEQKAPITEPAVPQTTSDSSNNVQPVETSSNGHADAPKKSYASLLKDMKAGASTTLVRVPPSAAKAPTPNTTQQAVAPPSVQQPRPDAVPATAPESSAPNGSNINRSSADQGEEKGHSIYIGDLPWDATTELVEQEFKKFGTIKRNGIQVRSNKGYCFGFVEYEDVSGQQKAIEVGTLRISGKEAFIQEKKTTTKVVNGVSMYPSGRGNFRNDGFRGRGNYSNGRGFARNDYKQRNGDAPPRSSRNGDGYQGVYQNGGGRGGRQGIAAK